MKQLQKIYKRNIKSGCPCYWLLSLSLSRFAPLSLGLAFTPGASHMHLKISRPRRYIYPSERRTPMCIQRSSRRTPYGRAPLTESGLAAFPHPALHMADLLSNLCVFNTFLLKSCFLAFPISEYCASYFLGYCPMWLPSLLWHYPHSSVIWSHPTAYTSFAFLLLVE